MYRVTNRVLFVLSLLLLVVPQRATSAQAPAVRGTVTDSVGNPVSSARVTVPVLNRTTTTDEEGRFVFRSVPSGTYHLTATRIGLAPAHADVTVPASGPDIVTTIRMRASALQLGSIQVTATPTGTDARDVAQAVTQLSGAELARNMGSTIAQTLGSEPGVSVRFNGPAAAAPVIRGLQGDRVLVLQDGARTGDLASSAADHAVSIDPLTADRIEVVRGPASLLYGNQALGGVVNVISNDIPTTIPSHLDGSVATQVESVNPGAGGTAGMTIPIGESFALVGRAGGRRSENLRMGGGTELTNSFARNYYGLGGFGFATPHASGGIVYRYYHQNYGLPSADDELARIEGARKVVEARSDFSITNSMLTSLRVAGTAQWYGHDEVNQESGNINTSFGLKTQTVDVLARTQVSHVAGAFGVSGILKQYEAIGDEALTPAANSNGIGAFVYEEFPLRSASHPDALIPKLQLGARYDLYRIDSKAGDAKFGAARSLDFNTFSGSIGATVPLSSAMTLSGSIARAFRAPTVEELFSNAVHEALGTFDVGNPNLEAEVNQGGEIVLRSQTRRINAQIAAYRNTIENFIAPNIVKDTTVDVDGDLTTLPLNRISQADALLYGAEGRVEVEVRPHLVFGATGDVVRGEFSDSKTPLSYMPPARLGGLARYDDGVRSLTADFRHGFAQERIPPAISDEDPAAVATDAYNLLNVSAGYVFSLNGRVNSLTLRVDNLLDEQYRDATSRIKSFAYNPGRNIALMYKVLF